MGEVAERVAAISRIETPRLIAATVRLVRDVGLAEDLVQDALVQALEQWPATGIPERPAAWLHTVARRRGIDHLRRSTALRAKHEELLRDHDTEEPPVDPGQPDRLGDDLLELAFVCCHQVLARPTRVALTLRVLGALSTAEIAAAYLLPEATIAQRIGRGKRQLAAAHASLALPEAEALTARLPAVLETIYLIFNEGYASSAGTTWTRPALCADALRMARMLAARSPRLAEVQGLVALLELQASRLNSRTTSLGEPLLLADQNRSRWSRPLIERGFRALQRAEEARAGTPPGPFELQAQIAACHARAKTVEQTDWVKIAALYAALMVRQPSPVVELNRAVAVSFAFGPAAALAIVDALRDEAALGSYWPLPAVRADLLLRLDRSPEARQELERALGLTENAAVRRLIASKLTSLE